MVGEISAQAILSHITSEAYMAIHALSYKGDLRLISNPLITSRIIKSNTMQLIGVLQCLCMKISNPVLSMYTILMSPLFGTEISYTQRKVSYTTDPTNK